MRLNLNNDATTDVEPDVVMPRDLAEWFVAMLDTFPHTRPTQETDPEEVMAGAGEAAHRSNDGPTVGQPSPQETDPE